MEDADPSELPLQPPTAINPSTKPASRCIANFTRSAIQSRLDPQHPERNYEPTSGWSSVQHDFERRLSRFGIKISKANSDPASSTSNNPIVQSRAGAHAIIDNYNHTTATRDMAPSMSRAKDFPPLETPTMASFTNKRETKLEGVERRLQQAQVEAQIWKEKCEAQERDLRVSYSETVEWRMKYEDLYSAIIQDREIHSSEWRMEREDTRSLG